MLILHHKTLLNLDTGIVIRWTRTEWAHDVATIYSASAATGQLGTPGYGLSPEFAAALWDALQSPSFCKRANVIKLGAGE